MDIQKYAEKVALMRTTQQEYYKVSGMAKHQPQLHTERKNLLILSKHLESEVDEITKVVLSNEKPSTNK